MKPDDLADLFGALAAAPRLPGAACIGRGEELFDLRDASDPDRPAVEAEALAICHQCPALAACGRWLDSLPPRLRPTGVAAGVVRRPRKAAQEPQTDTNSIPAVGITGAVA